MNGKLLVLDTNIVLYLLSGSDIKEKLKSKTLFISVITELELLSFPLIKKQEEKGISYFLTKVNIVDLLPDIKTKSILLRRKYRLSLPDAIICATAWHFKIDFVTNDKKLFKINEINSIELKSL
jgi:predicted nucleic acid-binding protein